jgi:hypothetical protein
VGAFAELVLSLEPTWTSSAKVVEDLEG